jgi:hypothetical protein
MNKEKLDELWKLVERVGEVDHLGYDAMVALGSVFGQMRKAITDQQKEIERLKEEIEQDGWNHKEEMERMHMDWDD